MNTHVSARHLGLDVSSDGDKQDKNDHEIDLCRSFLPRLELQTTTILTRAEHLPVHYLRCEAPHPIFNTSVVDTGDEFVFISRCSNLRKIRDHSFYYTSKPHDTMNVLHIASHGFDDFRVQWLDDELLRKSCPAAQYGVEDCRLFMWQGELWAIGAAVRPDQDWGLVVTQVIFKIRDGKVIDFFTLPLINGVREKNWIPHISDGRLFIIYSLWPMAIFEFRDGQLYLQSSIDEGSYNFDLRGGTQLVPWNGHFLGLVHTKPLLLDKFYYRHKFIVLDKNLNVLDLGEPFFIQKVGIEFACGLARSGENFILSYGVSDRVSAYCILPPAVIDRWVAI